jgi:hypothetical protein
MLGTPAALVSLPSNLRRITMITLARSLKKTSKSLRLEMSLSSRMLKSLDAMAAVGIRKNYSQLTLVGKRLGSALAMTARDAALIRDATR